MNDQQADDASAEGMPGQPGDEAILTAIAEIAREKLDWSGTVLRDTVLVESLRLDSIRQLTLVVALEDRFRVRFDEGEEASLRTAGDLVDLIRRKHGGSAADAR